MKQKSGERTLLASVVMSAPGPIVVGVGLLLGRSSTQLADFIRRTAELAVIIVSWLVYRTLNKSGAPDKARQVKLERAANLCVGAAMCLSGMTTTVIALFLPNAEKGNVIPGLVIAVLGVTTNTWFWLRYRKLNLERPNVILALQSKLYRAKSLVDACVTMALSVVAAAPAAPATRYVDLAGSIFVAVYLVVNGMIAIRGGNTDAPRDSGLPGQQP